VHNRRAVDSTKNHNIDILVVMHTTLPR